MTYSILDIYVLVIMLLSEIAFRKCTIHIMPPFEPNDEMLMLHEDKGETDWEIYAWCLRDAISKVGNFEKTQQNPYKERNAYIEYINGRTGILAVFDKLSEGSQVFPLK